LVEYHF